MYPTLRLKPHRIASLANRHPWIFSGALEKSEVEIPNGAIVSVVDPSGHIVATGTYSARSMIAVRVFAFADVIIDKSFILARIKESNDRRKLSGLDDSTTGYRIVFGESDHLPGLVVDRYCDVLVIQLATAGMEQLRSVVLESLIEIFSPSAIYERSDFPARTEEGLEPTTGLRYGDHPSIVEFREHGRRYLADTLGGQKTGFFLDQSDLRNEIQQIANDRNTVDLFSYSGAAGVAALIGGAEKVTFVDTSETAFDLCRKHLDLNGIDQSLATMEKADVFQWLGAHSSPEFDMILLDPPALIKSRKNSESGYKGYHFLNRAAMRIIRDGGILVTSSCSAYLAENDFAQMLGRAATQAGVTLSILKNVRQSPDHPLSIYFPEAFYLKSFICRIQR